MTYLLFKSLHIVAVITWMGGMVLMSVVSLWLAKLPQPRADREAAVVAVVRRWDSRVTSPAMGLAWLLGIVVAIQGEWYSDPWLHAKLVFVVALSALHGNLAAALRRLENDATREPAGYMRHAGRLTLFAVLVIVLLVVVKPF